MASLWQNFIGPIGQQGGFSGFFELGLKFHATVDQDIYALSYYATNTVTTDKPAQLDLWDHSTGTLVASTSAVGHTGSVGWQSCPLAAAFTAVAGHVYEVAMWLPTGLHVGTSATQPPAVPGLAFDSPGAVQAAIGSHVEPTSTSSFFWAVDINTVVSSSTGGSGGVTATPSDVDNSLADWLIATGDNTHQTDGLPWLTKAVVDAIQTTVNNIPQSSDSLWTAAGKLWQIAGALSTAEIAAWNLFAQRAPSQLTGASGGGGSAFYTGDGQLVSALVEQIWQATTPARSLPPGTGWTLADETDWDTTLAWDVPANCYLVTVDSYPPAQPATDGPAGTWLYRLGWWTVLNGSYSSGREWLEFGQQFLYRNGLYMPGLALQARGGTTGSVQAWVTG